MRYYSDSIRSAPENWLGKFYVGPTWQCTVGSENRCEKIIRKGKAGLVWCGGKHVTIGVGVFIE